MALVSVEEVRKQLGDAYASVPDDVVFSFIERHERRVFELTGRAFDAETLPESIREYIIAATCRDVILRDLSGVDSADALEFSIGDLRQSKDVNVQLKLKLADLFSQQAEKALNEYLARTGRFAAVSP